MSVLSDVRSESVRRSVFCNSCSRHLLHLTAFSGNFQLRKAFFRRNPSLSRININQQVFRERGNGGARIFEGRSPLPLRGRMGRQALPSPQGKLPTNCEYGQSCLVDSRGTAEWQPEKPANIPATVARTQMWVLASWSPTHVMCCGGPE